jgi:hypothetical protein
MNAEEVTREFIAGGMSPEQFNAALAEIPGPSSNPWLALYTEWENSDWDEEELRRRAEALLPDRSNRRKDRRRPGPAHDLLVNIARFAEKASR